MCVALVALLTEEMASQSFAYHAHGTEKTVANSAVIHGLCATTLNQQCIACSGQPHHVAPERSYGHSLQPV